jgi:PAS domain S-box-containing protein
MSEAEPSSVNLNGLYPSPIDDIFRRLIEAAPDAMIVVDASGTMLFVNSQTERLFGHVQAELVGEPIEMLIPHRFRAAHVGKRAGFTDRPKARPMGSGLELFGRKKDGTEFAVEVSLSPLETERGRLVSAAIRDVSERKQIEAAVRRANELLMNAVESFQGGLALYNSASELVMCNSSYRAYLGGSLPGEIVGRRQDELIDANLESGAFDLGEETPDAFRKRWHSYSEDPHGGLDVRLSNGQSVRLMERHTPDGGRVASILDVTSDVQRESELRAARALAEAASSAKSEFLASMSHELRTPLNAVLGFAQLLQRDRKSPLNERQLERLEHVLRGGEHLLHLIDEVLDLSRIEAGRVVISLEPVNVAEVLDEVIATLNPMAARAEIRLLQSPGAAKLPPVIADRTRFSQVLMNYGSNAIKYGHKHGSAVFSVAERDGGILRISVRDDGAGIPLDKQEKIFQPFQRAGQETGPIEGTGIGLTISKRLAEVMGGTVGFKSTPGQGSEFWIELPLQPPLEAPRPAVSEGLRDRIHSLTTPDGNRRLILYVEDNPSNLAFMEDFLADFPHVSLLTAPTAEIGIELALARRPDLILMDINLPGMSGFEAMRQLRQWPETREIPIVGLSAAAMIRDAKRVKEAGFVKYLTKPVNVDELATVLNELLAKAAGPAQPG